MNECKMTPENAIPVSSNTVVAMIIEEFGIKPIVEKMKALGVDVGECPYPAVLEGISVEGDEK